MPVAFRAQASWCLIVPSPPPGGRPRGTKQQVGEKGPWPIWTQNSLELGNKGSVHMWPWGADIRAKDTQASSRPTKQNPLPKPGSQQLFRLRAEVRGDSRR